LSSGVIQVDRIAEGLLSPTFAASAPGDPNRLFIAEKETGRIVIFDLATSQVLAEPFFQVPAEQMATEGMQGLLGFAFHPDYATNGKMYLSFTSDTLDTEIWEVTRSAQNPDVADPGHEMVLEIDRTSADNPSAWLGFGPDGLLYVTTGDSAGPSGEVVSAAQDPTDLRGKVLRIDVDLDAAPEVFALGLHDPWRASFDRATGDLYIGDIGEFRREEVDYLQVAAPAGTNFGWPYREGTQPVLEAPDPLALREPVFEYLHGFDAMEGERITGGYVYRGPGGMQGHYFFADFVSDRLFTLRVEEGQSVDAVERDDDFEVNSGTFDNIISFAEDGNGQLYALGLDGELFRFTMTDEPPPPPAGEGAAGGGGDGLAAIGVAAALSIVFGLFLF
jgi:hypothetical protein